MKKFEQIIKAIEASEYILITTHQNPDGDGIGAGIALLLGLNKLIKEKENYKNKIIRFVIDDKIPDKIKFLVGADAIENYSNYVSKIIPEIVISVDAGSMERIGKISEFKYKSKIINIDHHIGNLKFGDINYLDCESGSTSEISFEFLEELGVEFDKDISEALYVGIVNDTGNFKHSNVRKSTFLKAAKLIENGVNNTKIIENFYDNQSLAGLKLISTAINKMEFFENKKFITSYIMKKDFENAGGDRFDTEGIVEKLLMYDKAETSLVLRDGDDGLIKGSLRTKSNDLDLNEIAKTFGGGGHKKASGFSSKLPKEKIIEKILEIL
ncbi:MAG: DHH family phosphoesterase [Fusobacteriaceae bacterium]